MTRAQATKEHRNVGVADRDLPHELEPLGELALDLRWTWSHEADTLWERVDAEAWSRTRNPWDH